MFCVHSIACKIRSFVFFKNFSEIRFLRSFKNLHTKLGLGVDFLLQKEGGTPALLFFFVGKIYVLNGTGATYQ